MDLPIERAHHFHAQLVMPLLQLLQATLVAEHFGVQLSKVQEGTVRAVHRQDITRHTDQRTCPMAIIGRVEPRCLPGALDGFRSRLHHVPRVVPVAPEPACSWGERRRKDLRLQAWPGEAVDSFQPVFQRHDLTIEAIQLLAGTLAG